MNTQLPGPKHARADIGRAHRGRALLAAAAASLVALTGLSGVALASDENETPTPSTSASSPQTGATEGASSDETQPTGHAGAISSGTAGGSSAALEESATAGTPAATTDTDVPAAPELVATTRSGAPALLRARDGQDTLDSSTTGTVNAPQATLSASLTCTTGTIYTLGARGGLYSVATSTGAATNVSSSYSFQSDANGLGIVADGSAAYAVQQADADRNGNVNVYKYTASSGDFKTVGSVNLKNKVSGGKLIGGAVGSTNGIYYFGGYDLSGQFVLYGWDTKTDSSIGLMAVIKLSPDGVKVQNLQNGDIAFDSAGNLYLVYSASGYQRLASIPTKDVPATASTTRTLTASVVAKGTESRAYNGIVFDGSGTLFRQTSGTPSYIYAGSADFDGTGSNALQVNGGNLSAVDLASCSLPGSLTLQKNVVARANSSDQFTLAIAGGSTAVSATTSGILTGIQSTQVGPMVGYVGTEYTISETAASGSLTNYTTTYSCTYKSGASFASGSGASATLPKFPDSLSGDNNITCVFTNVPNLPSATVVISKQVADINGASPTPASGWTVGAVLSSPPSGVSISPDSTLVTSGTNGIAGPWTITGFSSLSATTAVTVSETQQAGYVFHAGSCTITHRDNSTTVVDVSSEQTTVPEISSGDKVSCTYTNKPASATLTLVKSVNNRFLGTAQNTDWTLTAVNGQVKVSGKTGSQAVTSVVVPLGAYVLSESDGPAGYVAGTWSCPGAKVNGSTVSLTQGANVTCTITNSDQPGSVTWSKTDNSSPANLLAGSEWTLKGPTTATDGVKVEDCTEEPCASGVFNDQDPVVGQFRLTGLSWGEYSLTEATPPVGYVRDSSSHSFTIDANHLTVILGSIKNSQVTPPSLPLTGGLGTDTFLLAGGGLLALAGIGGWIHRRRSQRLRMA